MSIKNTSSRYGLLSVSIHWLVAVAVYGLFGLGLWMTSLSYYSPWYQKAPKIHMTIGVILLLLMIFRVVWRFFSAQPKPIETHSALVRFLSKAGHLGIYLLLFVVMLSGYLIFTADGDPIVLLGGIEIPALITGIPNQADLTGAIHLYGAWTLVVLSVGHALAALKHHFIDKDATLKRMLP